MDRNTTCSSTMFRFSIWYRSEPSMGRLMFSASHSWAMVAIYNRSDMKWKASWWTHLEYHLRPLVFLGLLLYGARQHIDLLQKHTMGIFNGKDRCSFGRVRFWKAGARSAFTTSLYSSPLRSRDHQGKITLGSMDVVRMCNLDHEFRESRGTLWCRVSLARPESRKDTNTPSMPLGRVLLGSHLRRLI